MLSYRLLLACEQALMFCFRLTAPFPGTTAYYTISSRQEEKVIETAVVIFFKICTYRLSLVGPDGEKVGSISWRTDQAQRGPCAMTESQMFSSSARPDVNDKYFIIWPITIENFENFVSDLIWRDRRALAGNKKDSTIESFPLFFRVRTTKPQLIEKPRLFLLFTSFSLSFAAELREGRAGWLFRTGSRQPVRPYTPQLSLLLFLGITRAGFYGPYDDYAQAKEWRVRECLQQ